MELLTDRLNLPEGPVEVRTPAVLSPESARDLVDFLSCVAASVQRAAGLERQSPEVRLTPEPANGKPHQPPPPMSPVVKTIPDPR